MRVKQLELLGFKSFAQKTAIHFEPGVTAIVGPNGSGKSNLVDAIRWVLGEHNPRDVRAPRLEDVIFNGTDSKPPLSMAEVSLTIENDRGLLPIAFTEVRITRRVYRSGESEYLINQAPCRLKDIQELFLGTGLGGGTYAIIEQGHIDMILSSKPEERRGVFEEASGVAKYLAKKQETLRRLDEVEQHLTRIADIASEVRRQLNALERQASKARQYKTQWEQLKGWELRLAADEICQGEQAAQGLTERIRALTQQRQGLESQKQQLLASLEACNAEVGTTQSAWQEARTRVVEHTSQIDQHAGQVTLKTQWIDELRRQQLDLVQEEGQLHERLNQCAQQREQIVSQRAALALQATQLQVQHAQTAQELQQLEDALAQATGEIEHLKTELFEAAADASAQRNALASTTARLHAVQAQVEKSQAQQQAVEAKQQELAQRLDAAGRERQAAQEQQAALEQQVQGARQALAQAQGERHELLGRLNELRERVVTQRARVQLFEEVWRRHEGFPETVKAFLASPPDGVIGVLADLLEPQPGFERAVDAALGSLVCAIVVQDRAALLRCREHVAAHGLDGASFVVVHEPTDASASAAAVPPGVGQEPLSGVVRAESAYQPLLQRLLGSWVVVEDLQQLLQASPATSPRWVTRSGDRYDGRSWRVAGVTQSPSALVGRKRRWEQASDELQVLERDTAQAQAAWQRSEEQWQSLTDHDTRLRRQHEELVPRVSQLEAQASQLAHEERRLQDEHATLAMDRAELHTQHEELTASEQTLRQRVTDAEARQQALERTLAQHHARHEEARQRQQHLSLTATHVEGTLASCEERRTAIESRLQELHAEESQASAQRQAKQAQATALATKLTELTEQLETHRRQAASLTEARVLLEAQVEQVAQALAEKEQQRDHVLPSVLAAEQELLAVHQRLQEQESQLAEQAFRRTRLVERLHEIYHLEESALAAEQASVASLTDEERQQLAEQANRLKLKLEAMGPVSLGSVDEYDELTKRQEFLQTQQQDLIKARDDLKHSITQINRTARQQFRDTFTKIQEEFQRYYIKLFGGGEANLILLDEDDVLESGIEIVARPPGKRLQSISLLSGGERALTAIALLFALFKVRPSPFCILDEIDAPLDEANVDRFTRALEEFLSLSQFILITHNKKTITKADSLYGVTMEQPGISKLVSVKLTKTPSTAAVPPPVEEAGIAA